MHLARVDVRNFGCFRELRVDLQSGLNVLVGRNNVGKTTLLHAIRHALGPTASRGESLWLDEDDFHRTATREHAGAISIVLTFENLSEQQRVAFYEILEFDRDDVAASRAVVRFRAQWNPKKGQAVVRRTGGAETPNAPDVPSEILAALPVTFLPALRNAEECLAPGHKSRLALMLRDLMRRHNGGHETEILRIFQEANASLQVQELIETTRASLQDTATRLAGSDYLAPDIRVAGVDLNRILRTLQVQMPTAPVEALSANGLGYNNLLYMAVVLEHLAIPAVEECPLLMIEEPEAHLHPQLTTLLAEFLSKRIPAQRAPQTLVSTHSPTLVASVPPERINLLFAKTTGDLQCSALSQVNLTPKESGAVRRLMDVTRASMYFAKGLILVEGISEALLIPVLAERCGICLTREHMAVIPLCGVGFDTLDKLLGPRGFGVPTAIITDGDPPLLGDRWENQAPEREAGEIVVSDRTKKLIATFADRPVVKVVHSKVTLEYDLALAGAQNAEYVAEAWERCFKRKPRTVTRAMVEDASLSTDAKALRIWRGICLAESAGSKAELAQHLAASLSEPGGCPGFVVPPYIEAAIRHVVDVKAPNSFAPTSTRDARTHA